MKILHIKAIYKIDGVVKTSEATVPYILNSEQKLPNDYPFNQNVYFGPDNGAFLGVIHINESGKVYYMDDIIFLKRIRRCLCNPFHATIEIEKI